MKVKVVTVNEITWILPPGCQPDIWDLRKSYPIENKKEKNKNV